MSYVREEDISFDMSVLDQPLYCGPSGELPESRKADNVATDVVDRVLQLTIVSPN